MAGSQALGAPGMAHAPWHWTSWLAYGARRPFLLVPRLEDSTVQP